MIPPTNDVRVALAGKSLPALLLLLLALARASMPAGAASRYALGAGGVGAARPAPAASLISASRYGARRSAHGAARRGRCAPVCVPGGAAAGCHRRLALRARRRDGVQRLGPGRLYGSPVAASRCALGTKGVGAARPSAHMCSPGCARCLLGMVGMSKTSCALRCSRRSVQRALRAPAEGEGGGGLRHHHAQVCGGTLACYRSMCSVCRLRRRWPRLAPRRASTLAAAAPASG